MYGIGKKEQSAVISDTGLTMGMLGLLSSDYYDSLLTISVHQDPSLYYSHQIIKALEFFENLIRAMYYSRWL